MTVVSGCRQCLYPSPVWWFYYSPKIDSNAVSCFLKRMKVQPYIFHPYVLPTPCTPVHVLTVEEQRCSYGKVLPKVFLAPVRGSASCLLFVFYRNSVHHRPFYQLCHLCGASLETQPGILDQTGCRPHLCTRLLNVLLSI